MEKQLIFYIAGVSGVLVHFLLKIRDASTKSEVFNWKKNAIASSWSIVLIAVMVAFRLDLVSLLSKVGVDLQDIANNLLLWFLIGYFADSVWKNIEKTGSTILKVQDPTEASVTASSEKEPTTESTGENK